MNILFVIHYPIFGGPHNQAIQLNIPLSVCSWKTVVLLPDEAGNAAQRLSKAGVEVVQMPLHRLRATLSIRLQANFCLRFWPEICAIRRLIRVRQINLVVIGGLINPHAAIAACLEGIPVVWQILDTRPPMLLRRLMMPLVTRFADTVMSTGINVAQVHPGTFGMNDRLVPFFPPVDTNNFRPNPTMRSQARAELGVPEDAILIGTVGNINPQKGHEYLIRAASMIHSQVPKLFVRILGGHTPTHACYEDRLRHAALSSDLLEEKRLQFVYPGSRVAKLLPAFDIFLLTSVPRSEGIPTTILEAMSCGLPIVATDVGAVREVVEDGVTGFVVPPLDPQAITQATLRLIHDPKLLRHMGEQARQHAVECYDVEVCADTHVRAFEAALIHHRRKLLC